MFLFHLAGQYDDVAYARGASANPIFVALMPASDRSALRRRPFPLATARERSSVNSCTEWPAQAAHPLGTSPGHASPSARASANNTGRLASEATVLALRTALRHVSTTSAFEAAMLQLVEQKEPLSATRNQGVPQACSTCGCRFRPLL